MYPDEELDGLALRKSLICARITVRRQICVVAAGRVAEPLRWADRALEQWKRISPMLKLAVVPLALMAKRRLFSRGGNGGGRGGRNAADRGGMIAKLLRWAPMVSAGFRMFSAMRR